MTKMATITVAVFIRMTNYDDDDDQNDGDDNDEEPAASVE